VRDIVYYIMSTYANQIIFLHVLSAVVWLGAMISARYGRVKPLRQLSTPEEYIYETERYKRFFKLTLPFIILLFITSLMMALGYKDNAIDPEGFMTTDFAVDMYKMIHTKGTIWTVMAMNMGLMAWINSKAAKNFDHCSNMKECKKCKDALWIIYNYLLPINIILGAVEIMLGVILQSSF